MNGEVLNRGVVSPGPVAARQVSAAGVGTLRVGSFDQDPEGVLEIECAGTIPGLQIPETAAGGWDSLLVSGQAQLEGTLRVVRNLQLAHLPDTAEVVRYGSRQGTFGTVAVKEFTEEDEIAATPSYMTSALRVVLSGTLSVVGVEEAPAPRLFHVYPNFPNPFRSATTIRFDLPVRADVKLRIYDVQGRLVRTLMDLEPMEPGAHERRWLGEDDEGRRVSSGVYFYKLEAGKNRQVRRIVKLQ
jgi:hypothetical protein